MILLKDKENKYIIIYESLDHYFIAHRNITHSVHKQA
jgi:hypothetical protein